MTKKNEYKEGYIPNQILQKGYQPDSSSLSETGWRKPDAGYKPATSEGIKPTPPPKKP